jgi:hypothetical protein
MTPLYLLTLVLPPLVTAFAFAIGFPSTERYRRERRNQRHTYGDSGATHPV